MLHLHRYFEKIQDELTDIWQSAVLLSGSFLLSALLWPVRFHWLNEANKTAQFHWIKTQFIPITNVKYCLWWRKWSFCFISNKSDKNMTLQIFYKIMWASVSDFGVSELRTLVVKVTIMAAARGKNGQREREREEKEKNIGRLETEFLRFLLLLFFSQNICILIVAFCWSEIFALFIPGLPSVFLSAASCVRWHTPCSLRTRLCPLLIQTRQRTNKRTRFKAPHEPKQKDKWSKAMREK